MSARTLARCSVCEWRRQPNRLALQQIGLAVAVTRTSGSTVVNAKVAYGAVGPFGSRSWGSGQIKNVTCTGAPTVKLPDDA